jgi:hypothetical protein
MAKDESLPKYISFRGHGETTVPVPVIVSNATLYGFALACDPKQTQKLVDETLNQIAPGKIEYVVLGHHVLLCFMHCAHCISPANIGWEPDHETAFFIPLVEKQAGTSEPVKLVMWIPYLLIDSTIGMLTGREVWGFNKTYGETSMPQNPDDAARFTSKTTIFPVLNDRCKGEFRTLVQMQRTGSLGTLKSIWNDTKSVLSAIKDGLGPWTVSWKDELELAVDLLKLAYERQAPFINLKQFRDATYSDRACLTQLVECDFSVTSLMGAGLLEGRFNLSSLPARVTRSLKTWA